MPHGYPCLSARSPCSLAVVVGADEGLRLVGVEDTPVPVMRGTTARFAPAFAIQSIMALHHIAFAIGEVGNAVEVAPITEGGIGSINEFTRHKVIFPGISVDP